jgi:hypothetical protein
VVPQHLLVGQRAPRHRPIERKDLGVHDRGVQVPDHNGQRRQDRFIEMDRAEQVERPVGEAIQERGLEPQPQTRHHHDDGAPHQRPVLHLFPVSEAPVCWACPYQAKVVLQGSQQLAPIREAGWAKAHACAPTADQIDSTPHARQDGTGHLASARGQHQIPKVIHAEAHEEDSSAPMEHGTRWLLHLPSDPGQPPPQTQRESCAHQRDKAYSGEPVLEALIDGKPQEHWPSEGVRGRRAAAPVTPAALEVHAIVGRHQPDHDDNHAGVHRADRVHQRVPPGLRRVMHSSLRETLSRARMALPTGPPQAHRMDRGEGARRWSDLVIPMATRAVRDAAVTGRSGETVKAPPEIFDYPGRQVMHRRHLHRPVAAGARLSRDTQSSGGGGGICRRALRMHAMAAGARRRVEHAAHHCRAVHTPLKGQTRLDVTGATRLPPPARAGQAWPCVPRGTSHRSASSSPCQRQSRGHAHSSQRPPPPADGSGHR